MTKTLSLFLHGSIDYRDGAGTRAGIDPPNKYGSTWLRSGSGIDGEAALVALRVEAMVFSFCWSDKLGSHHPAIGRRAFSGIPRCRMKSHPYRLNDQDAREGVVVPLGPRACNSVSVQRAERGIRRSADRKICNEVAGQYPTAHQ